MRRKKPKKTKLKEALWKICSEYVRKRDKNICFTCGRWAEGSGYHAGHFIASSICGSLLRHDERNLKGQCYNCNINLGGNGPEYYRRMVALHGQEYVDTLFKEKETNNPWKEQDYLDKIEYYKNKLKD